MIKRILSISVLLIAFTIISRILGFLRETIIAYKYGTSLVVDQYVTSQIVGELIGNVILVGVFSTYTILVLRKYNSIIMKKVIIIGILLSVIITILIMIFSDVLVKMVLFDTNLQEALVIKKNFLIIAPTIPLLTLTSILNGYLQYREKYLQPVFAIIVMNIGFILSLFVLNNIKEDMLLPIAYVISVILYLIYSLIVYMFNKRELKESSLVLPNYKEILNEIKPILITTVIMKIILITDRIFGSMLDEGKLAAYNFALKLMNLPIAIIATSMINIMFVRLLKSKEDKDLDINLDILFKISIFVTVFTIVFSQEIVSLVYGYGAFEEKSIIETSNILRLVALTLPLQFLFLLYQKVVYSRLTNKKIFWIASLGIVINLSINIMLVPIWGILGIILGTFLSLLIQCFMFHRCLTGKLIIYQRPRDILLIILIIVDALLIKFVAIKVGVNVLICLILYLVVFYFIQRLIKINLIRKVIDLNDSNH